MLEVCTTVKLHEFHSWNDASHGENKGNVL